MQAASVQTGDPFPQEFEELFQENYALVYRTAFGVTGRVEDAEDVVQTIFLRLLQRARPRDFLKNPGGYLYRAAVNQSLTIVEARRRRALTETAEDLAVSMPARMSGEAEDLHRRLYEAIAQLKPKTAAILILRYLHDYSDAEIARLLGTSRGVIAVTLYRSRARLKALMAGANSFYMTPGRTYGLCLTTATLIRTAYGYTPARLDFVASLEGGAGDMQFGDVYGLGQEDGLRVRGGPDWVRSERYTLEAVAGGAANAETMRGPMLRALLDRRFKLKVHVEVEQVPAFTLTVAPGGPKLTPAQPGDCDLLPGREGAPLINGFPGSVLKPPRTLAEIRSGQKISCGMWQERVGPNMVFKAGDVPISALRGQLAGRLGGVHILDQTGLTGRYTYLLEFANDQNAPGLAGGELRARGPVVDAQPADTIFTAIEQQLGLRLEPARAPREYLVIDAIERPSPN